MPNAYVDKFPNGEEKWKEAKKKAKDEGKGDNYAYIMSIFKSMVHASVARVQRIVARLRDNDDDSL